MILASLVIEREPTSWHDLATGLRSWTEDVGGFAAVGLAAWLLYAWLFRPARAGKSEWSSLQSLLFKLAVIASICGYGFLGILKLPELFASFAPAPEEEGPAVIASWGSEGLQHLCLMAGAIGALLAVLMPLLGDLVRLRWRRIWALAQLSIKEAVRKRILWVFSAILLVFLFASWFMEYKPENQVRNYVTLVYWAMTLLLLMTASLLAAFSIPSDVKTLAIHTIVTKPVERFEIVLGRFVGYTILMSAVLLVMTTLSLLYLVREIDPDAKIESMRARVPIFGELKLEPESINVGREWEYRGYVPGERVRQSDPVWLAEPAKVTRAVWSFPELPADLLSQGRPTITCELTFDIFRTLKGEEGKGIFCSFMFLSHQYDPKQKEQYRKARDEARLLLTAPA